MKKHHPLFLGPTGTKLRGVWVRHKSLDYEGWISYVERKRNPEERPLLWIVYPPGRLSNGTKIKTYSAGCAHSNEVVRIKRKRRKV